MRHLSLDQIQSLIEVIKRGSYTAAASELHLTQPAISLHVQELENRLQVKLVERVGRRIRPTAAGRELEQLGRRLLDQADETQRIMRRYSQGFMGQVRIGMSMTVLIYLMPPIIRDLKARAPAIELVVKTGFSVGTMEAVAANDLDIGLCIGAKSDRIIEAIPLGSERLAAIFPPDTADVPGIIEPGMIARWPVILGNPRSALRTLVDNWIGPDNRVPPIMELDNVAAIKSVVAGGLGVSLVPEIAIREEDRLGRLIVRPLRPVLERTLILVQRKDKLADPAITKVREALTEQIRLATA